MLTKMKGHYDIFYNLFYLFVALKNTKLCLPDPTMISSKPATSSLWHNSTIRQLTQLHKTTVYITGNIEAVGREKLLKNIYDKKSHCLYKSTSYLLNLGSCVSAVGQLFVVHTSILPLSTVIHAYLHICTCIVDLWMISGDVSCSTAQCYMNVLS